MSLTAALEQLRDVVADVEDLREGDARLADRFGRLLGACDRVLLEADRTLHPSRSEIVGGAAAFLACCGLVAVLTATVILAVTG